MKRIYKRVTPELFAEIYWSFVDPSCYDSSGRIILRQPVYFRVAGFTVLTKNNKLLLYRKNCKFYVLKELL